MKKKKVLIVTTFDFEGTRWGRNFPLARAFERNGYDVTMLVTEKRKSLKLYTVKECEGVKVICFNAILPFYIRKLPAGLFTLSFWMRLIYAMFHKFDIVYSDCGETPCAGWPCLANKWIYGSKYLSEYGDLLGKGGYYDMKSKTFKMLFGAYFLWAITYFRKKADYTIVLSKVMGEYVEKEMGIAKEKIVLVPGGSLPEKIEYKLPEKSAGEPIYLGYIGVDDYEITGILPVLDAIRTKYSDKFKVRLFGRKLSQATIDKYSLKDIIIECGWVDVIKGQDEVRKCDIFMLMRENLLIGAMGWPNKLGDYLSYGRPVMISPYGDLIEFVDKHSDGFIVVDRNNNKDIEEKLAAIVNSDIDLVQKGAYNRIVAEKEISWDARIAKLIESTTI